MANGDSARFRAIEKAARAFVVAFTATQRKSKKLRIHGNEISISLSCTPSVDDIIVRFKLRGKWAVLAVGEDARAQQLVRDLGTAWLESEEYAEVALLLSGASYRALKKRELDERMATNGTRVLSDAEFALLMRQRREKSA